MSYLGNDSITLNNRAAPVPVDDCFLCKPAESLIVKTGKLTTIIAGLGPIVQNYCLIGSNQHDRSFADLSINRPDAIEELAEHRAKLESRLGPILVTEHGRVPVCRRDDDQHEQHCHHAHMLLFPLAPSIEEPAKTFYRECRLFERISDALDFAAAADNYLLISPEPNRFLILTEPLAVPRQLSRILVAHTMGIVNLGDWRSDPNFEASTYNAQRLRLLLGATA